MKDFHSDAGSTLAIVIMVEPGYLEFQSICLISSLNLYCTRPFKVYPYCRADRIDKLTPITKAFLAEKTEGIRPIEPAFALEYPQGNKIYACAEDRPEREQLFLDTDMVMMKKTALNPVRMENAVVGVQGTITTWTEDPAEYDAVYRKFGMEPPKFAISVRPGRLDYPYMNGGFVYFSNPDFGKVWLDVALQCDFDDAVPNKRPWLDQMTLPVAIHKADMRIGLLTNHWNGTPKLAAAEKRGQYIQHYHTVKKIGELEFTPFFDKLLQETTEYGSLVELTRALDAQGANSLKTNLAKNFDEQGREKQKAVEFMLNAFKRNK